MVGRAGGAVLWGDGACLAGGVAEGAGLGEQVLDGGGWWTRHIAHPRIQEKPRPTVLTSISTETLITIATGLTHPTDIKKLPWTPTRRAVILIQNLGGHTACAIGRRIGTITTGGGTRVALIIQSVSEVSRGAGG